MHKQIPPTAALMLAVAIVFVGGRMIDRPSEFEMPGAEDFAITHDPLASASVEQDTLPQVQPATPSVPAADGLEETGSEVLVAPPASDALPPEEFDPGTPAPAPAEAMAASRQVAPAGITLPELGGQDLQREAPRDPLSQLSLALPPKPEPKNPWAGKPLFRPVATESAVFESGGQTISIDGVESVRPDETCSYEGSSWPCGVRARAAFRAWLRGRALVCQLPEGQDEAAMRGTCRLAKQDAGEWLVENGWARATPDGPYAQAGEKAAADKRGIFGTPPDTTNVGDVPDMPASAVPAAVPSILSNEGADPQPADPRMAFPPAPPNP